LWLRADPSAIDPALSRRFAKQAEEPVAMMIDERRFMELAVHVKLASEAIATTASHLNTLRPPETETVASAAWCAAMDELIALNVELGFMERMLRKTARANAPQTTHTLRKVRAVAS
jgi:hypothetical protein